jgi:hypothetical protein
MDVLAKELLNLQDGKNLLTPDVFVRSDNLQEAKVDAGLEKRMFDIVVSLDLRPHHFIKGSS